MINYDTDDRPASIDLPPWGAEVGPGHVLAFAYPRRGKNRPDPEPHLVVELGRLGEEPALVLAPGLPAIGQPSKGAGIFCTKEDLVAVRSLHAPTLFVAERRLIVPCTHHGLAEAAVDGTPSSARSAALRSDGSAASAGGSTSSAPWPIIGGTNDTSRAGTPSATSTSR